MRSADIARWDGAARAGFTYTPDGEVDTWRSHADDVLAGRPWKGDCDDLASTVADLLGRDGQPLRLRFRLLVDSTRTAQTFDHMVAATVDDAGGFWVVGDTFGEVYPAGLMEHRPVAYQRLDEWNPDGSPRWRDGVPWAAA